MEPEWTKKIPSWVVCDWFYVFFAVNAFVFTVMTLALLYVMFTKSGVFAKMRGAGVFMSLVSMAVSGTSALFFYLMCDRSLKPAQ